MKLGWATRIFLTTTGFFLIACFSPSVHPQHLVPALAWAPAGILFTSLLLVPKTRWPSLLLALGLADFLARFAWPALTLGPRAAELWAGAAMAAAGAAVDLAACLAAAAVGLRSQRASFELDSLRAVLHFLVVGCGVGGTVAATLGALLVVTTARSEIHPGTLWFYGWFSFALGTLCAGPPILLATGRGLLRRISHRPYLEVASMFILAVATTWIGYVMPRPSTPAMSPLLFAPFPILLWAAVRFDVAGASLASLLVTLGVIVTSILRLGPFAATAGAELANELGIQCALFSMQAAALALAGAGCERHQTRHALQQGEALLRDVLENTPAAVFVKDTTGRYRLVNRAYAAQLQRSHPEILDRTDADLLPPERAAARTTLDRQVLDSGCPLEVEEELPGPNGTQTCLVLRFPLRDHREQIYGLCGLFTDISARKRIESDLRQSERLRQSILDASPHLVYVLDLAEPRMVFLSRRTQELLDLSPDQVLAQSPLGLLACVHPDDQESVRHALTAWSLATDGEVRHLEYRLRDRTGQWRWFLDHGAVFQRSTGGLVRQIVGVVQDIDSQRSAEQALRDHARTASLEAALARALAQELPVDDLIRDVVRALHHHLELTYAAAWLPAPGGEVAPVATIGSTPEPPSPQWIRLRFDARQPSLIQLNEDRPPLQRGAMPFLLDEGAGGVLVIEGPAPGIAKRLPALEMTAGHVALGVQRRLADERIRQLNEALERRVRERTEELERRVVEAEQLNRGMVNLLEDLQQAQGTAELSARQLEAANLRLDHANRELEAFSYSVSHDLQAPLRNISGFVDLLTREAEAPADRGRHFLAIIRDESRRMSRLITDLLAFSRIGRAELHLEFVAMQTVVERTWNQLQPDRANREITWRLDTLPPVRADASLIALVWSNLLGNALKYTRPRSVASIHVGSLPGPEPPDQAIFFVRDNGVGFDMQYADKLFGVFQRLHSVGEFEGTGIGLANVKRIVHRHGGRVWAESRKEVGSTFYFSLPILPS